MVLLPLQEKQKESEMEIMKNVVQVAQQTLQHFNQLQVWVRACACVCACACMGVCVCIFCVCSCVPVCASVVCVYVHGCSSV